MLSSTSLLHGNCVFNRNNTVATQQGMKTYWLCKSYRITMCRARCITHQGRVISATGVHNHQPHMKGAYSNSEFVTHTGGNGTSPSISGSNSNVTHTVSMRLPSVLLPSTIGHSSAISQSSTPPPPPPPPPPPSHMQQHQSQQVIHQSPNGSQSQDTQPPGPAVQHHSTSLHHNSPSQGHADHQHAEHHTTVSTSNNSVNLQTMMHSALAPNSLMHLSNMAPILNPIHQHHTHPSHLGSMHGTHTPSSLQITPILNNENNNSQNLQSPNSPRNAGSAASHAHQQQQHSLQSHHHHMSNQAHQMASDHHHGQQAMSVTTTSTSDAVANVASPISAQQQQHIMSMPMSSQSQSSFKMEQM